MKTMLLADFHAACKAQACASDLIVVKCPRCGTLQTGQELIAAGAGADFDAVRGILGYSCIGRYTGAPSPRRERDGKPCNWTLSGLFQLHDLEVVTPEGKTHPHFDIASPEEAAAHHALIRSAEPCPPA